MPSVGSAKISGEMTPVAAFVSAVALASGLHATVAPVNATRDGQVRIAVTGAPGAAAQVRVVGGIASGGRWFGWVALQAQGHGAWSTVLRAPGYLGVYPLELRLRGGSAVELDGTVRILPKGFFSRPVFEKAEQVAQWWTRIAPPGAVLQSVSTWGTGFYTHRDDRFNRLLSVHFRLLGAWRAAHLSAGPGHVFLSIARVRLDGGWRLLQVVSAP
jgi:hypothetical protein